MLTWLLALYTRYVLVVLALGTAALATFWIVHRVRRRRRPGQASG